MTWTQVKVTCKTQELETVCAVMSMVDCSVMIEDYSDVETELSTVYGDLIDESILNSDKSIASCSIYVPEDRNVGEEVSYIESMLETDGIHAKIEVLGTDEDEWSTAWKKYYKSTPLTRRLVVVPSWETYEKRPGELVVSMDPGMAFGTGTHETTRLCAQLLEDYLSAGDRMLDVGSGSGILAICAAKLGASECLACDIDPVAVRTEEENVRRNGCANIRCITSDLLSEIRVSDAGVFDVVTANIVADVIIKLAPELPPFMKKGGRLIASGIIEPRAQEVDGAVEKYGFCKIGSKKENGWYVGIYEKR